MPTVWNSERWTDAGYNEAGDRVYERSNVGSSGTGAAATSSSQMTKSELVALAKERGVATSGTKDELISRLGGIDV